MGKRILLIQGHPDSSTPHLCHALEESYAKGAAAAGHEVKRVDVGKLDFPLLRSQEEWEHGALPRGLAEAQSAISWAEHIVFLFPLWMGDMPAVLKGFLEQVARPGFAFLPGGKNPMGQKALRGRSARIGVTMGMPAFVYRWFFFAHAIKLLQRNILGFVGIHPVRHTVIGMVGSLDMQAAQKWLDRLQQMGCNAE